MDDSKRSGRTVEATAPKIERRDVLGLIGVGGLLLTLPTVAKATGEGSAEEAAVATPTPDCGAPQPCPSTKPPLPNKPDVSKLPGLAQLIGTLARHDAEARTNRRQFNTCPDKFLDFYSLDDADVAALLDFKSSSVDGQFVYLGPKVPTSKPDEYASFLQLYAVTDNFWRGWPGYQPKDCYDDPDWCEGDIEQAYAHPNTRIIEVTQDDQAGTTLLTVTAEGLVRSPAMEVVRVDDGSVVAVTDVAVDAKSTFRCGRITGKAQLETGKTYIVRLTLAGALVRTSNEFIAI